MRRAFSSIAVSCTAGTVFQILSCSDYYEFGFWCSVTEICLCLYDSIYRRYWLASEENINQRRNILDNNRLYLVSRDSVVGIATGWTTEGSEFESRRLKNFLFFTSSIQVLGSAEPPIQWVPRPLPGGRVKTQGHEAGRLQPMPRSRKCGSIHLLPHTPSWGSHWDNFTLSHPLYLLASL
jgi:hypothetical protein